LLFSSIEFVLVFLPLTLGGFVLLRQRAGNGPAQLFLVAASFFFYGWWDIRYVPMLAGSIALNFVIGLGLGEASRGQPSRRALLAGGVIFNLALLGLFKYLHFFANTALWAAGSQTRLVAYALPLGISFFTFQQIAYLVELFRRHYPPAPPVLYALFVSFFPQLIAGPIVQYGDMAPQFLRQRHDEPIAGNLAIGLTIFIVGLFKKLVLADWIGPRIDEIHAAVALGAEPTLIEAWVLALGYSLQLYFDFSGYSDMAIGLGRMFGITLPVNFLSPYKARSISDFWRRWHITLSSFLRDYLYIPLGGNRASAARVCLNLFVTMVVGGVWHGAGWTFVIWGALHGAFLVVNHLWRQAMPDFGARPGAVGAAARLAAQSLTFLCVMTALLFFRAASVEAAVSVLAGMLGGHGIALPSARQMGRLAPMLAGLGLNLTGTPFLLRADELAVLALMAAITWLAPNIYEVMAEHAPALRLPKELGAPTWIRWRPSPAWAGATAGLAGVAFFRLNANQVFLYYNF
jgi:D-alanyl-lipoteichoic acid acyltransferase DltB (MBOAT superfamily)